MMLLVTVASSSIDGAASDHRIRTDDRARLDLRAGVHVAGLLQPGAFLHPGVGRHDRRVPIGGREDAGLELPVEHVPVDLHVFLRGPDVDPVAAIDVGEERFAALDERREIAALDRVGHVLGNAIEGPRLEHVDAGVDRVAGDLVGARLLEEALHGAVGRRLDQAVGGRVVHRREDDRRQGLPLAVERDHLLHVHRRHHVAVEDDDRVGDVLRREFDGAAGAERRRLDHIPDAHAGARAIAEDLFDPARLIVEAENDLVDLRHLLQLIDLIVQERAVEDGNDGLGRVNRERAQSRALAPCKENCFHDNRTILPRG